jgi:hypothetical protein
MKQKSKETRREIDINEKQTRGRNEPDERRSDDSEPKGGGAPKGGGTQQSYQRGGAGQGQTGGGPGNTGQKN